VEAIKCCTYKIELKDVGIIDFDFIFGEVLRLLAVP
jgi:hypothetical protein